MATLRFAKLHGTANDFVYVDARDGFPGDPATLAPPSLRPPSRHRRRRSHPARAVHAVADCRMTIYNADGSRAEMCGNGIRGFAKFVPDRGLVRADPLRVETDAGVKTDHAARWTAAACARVTVDMGVPDLERPRHPGRRRRRRRRPPARGRRPDLRVTCVSMGNPHCVVFVDDVAELDLLERSGPASSTTRSSRAA